MLEQKLGEGGFGEVWLGRHQTMKERRVFKFCFRADRVRSLKREMTLFRILKERVGDHPNIVRLLEVYFDEPPFYVVMDHVEGQDLKAWCEEQGGVDKVPLATRLEIVAQIADALQAAHDAGVIHRDVKPGNILVSFVVPPSGGRAFDTSGRKESERTGPAEAGTTSDQPAPSQAQLPVQVKLTDFGIGQIVSAEALAGVTNAGFTQTIVAESSSSQTGSQMYMAPELLAGKPASTRSDIYSLGVVLYQLLVEDLTRPLTTDWGDHISDPLLRDDLKQCFAGDPLDRFEGAGQLAKNLRALETRRSERRNRVRAQQTSRRRRQIAVLTSGIAGVFLLLACALGYGLHRAKRSELRTRQNLYVADMNLVQQAWDDGDLQRAQSLLRSHAPRVGEEDQRGFEWRYLRHLCQDESRVTFTNFAAPVWSLQWLPNRLTLAALADGAIQFLDSDRHRPVGELRDPSRRIQAYALSPADTNLCATVGDDGVIKQWDLSTKAATPIFTNAPISDDVASSLTYSPNGKILASAGGRILQILNVETKTQLWTRKLSNPFVAVAFTLDGQTFVSGGGDGGTAMLWDSQTGIQLASFPLEHTAWINRIAFSPDGQTLATVGNDSKLILWDFFRRQPKAILTGHRAQIRAVAFSSNGQFVATGGADHTVRVWDADNPRLIRILRGHHGNATSVAFTARGALVSASVDGSIKIWDLNAPTRTNELKGHQSWLSGVAFSPDGKNLASADYHRFSISVWDVASQRRIAELTNHTAPIFGTPVFSDDGTILSAGSADRTIRLWDMKTLQPMGLPLTNDFWVQSVAFAPDKMVMAAAGGGLSFWATATGEKLNLLNETNNRIYSVAISLAGVHLATGDLDGAVTLWDLKDRRLLARFKEHDQIVPCVTFSRDGALLASVGGDESIVLYRVSELRSIARFTGHVGALWWAAFTPDNKTLASAGSDGTVKFWHLATGESALTLKAHLGPTTGLAFAPDGNLMATCGADARIWLWPAAPASSLGGTLSRQR